MQPRHLSSGQGYHLFHNCGHKGGKKRPNADSKFLSCIPSTSTKNSAEDVSTANVIGHATITQRKGEGSDVISDDTVRGVDTIGIFCTEFPLVWPDASQFLDLVEYRGEDVSVVI